MVTEDAKLKIWEPIRDANCKLCPLHESAQSVCLMGDGPVPSKIVLVGEAPGFREDEISKPFAGAAGQYLDRVLSEVGLPRESVYITNAAKCRPPENRTPTRTELRACHPFLQREFEVLKPEYILTLGNAALESITGKKGVMKVRGSFIEKNGYRILPTLHPAAILRNPAWEPLFKSDLQTLARAVMGRETKPETKIWTIKTSKSLGILLKKLQEVQTPIAFDVETWSPDENGGLSSWHPQGLILSVSFTWQPGESYVVVLEHPDQQWDIPISTVYQSLAVALESKRMVGHNVKFDMKWMRKKGVKLTAWFDTLLAAHLLDENRPNGLKPLSRLFLGADQYEIPVEIDTPIPRLATYNGRDTDYTLRLYHIFRQDLKRRPRLLRLFKRLIMPACNALTEIEMQGFPVDMGRLKSRHKEILQKIEESRNKMIEFIPEELRPPPELINFRSPVFLSWYFFDLLELPVIEYSPKTGKPSTKESVLLKLKNKHPAAAMLMELRKWMKYESTYTRSWLVRTRSAGKPRVYTSYNISGTVTGRLSSDMQQVPRDLLIRSIIGFSESYNRRRSKDKAKSPRRFVEADFSQIELRLAAMYSGDRELTGAFQSGRDPHTETASAVTGKAPKSITKEERKMAKAVNFGFLYGMGARKFVGYADEKYQVKISLEEAQDFRKAFFKQYRGLLPWHDRQRRIVRSLSHVTSSIGRVRHLPAIQSSDEGLQAAAEREAINSPVQGLASDLTLLSMVLLHQKLDRNRARVIGNVHDSVLFEVDDDYSSEATKIIKETMENLPLKQLFDFTPSVPIEVDVNVSDHWGES